jgi:endonuclease/exonuclease/phosphatase family metal-dependent hydrolase
MTDSVQLLAITALACLAACAQPDDAPPSSFLERQDAGVFQLRLLTWNVKYGSIFPPEGRRHAGFARIVRAVNPDVLVLQEVDPRWADRLAKMMDRIIPLGHSRLWEIHGASDNVIISRYPLLQRDRELVVPHPVPRSPEFQYGQAMALVDLPDNENVADVYVVAMHNRSRSGEENVQQRQQQSDSIVRWLRTLRDENTIAENTPIVVAGDMNVLPSDPARHLATLLTGNIANEETFGPDFSPDWDGTELADASPSHNGRGEAFYTWRDDSEPYPPGQLSRILFTDSVLSLNHGFVVNTVDMSPDELHKFGLLATDCLLDGEKGVFDHMPVVADFLRRDMPH